MASSSSAASWLTEGAERGRGRRARRRGHARGVPNSGWRSSVRTRRRRSVSSRAARRRRRLRSRSGGAALTVAGSRSSAPFRRGDQAQAHRYDGRRPAVRDPPIGAEGLGLGDLEELLVADSPDALARLALDPTTMRGSGSASRPSSSSTSRAFRSGRVPSGRWSRRSGSSALRRRRTCDQRGLRTKNAKSLGSTRSAISTSSAVTSDREARRPWGRPP